MSSEEVLFECDCEWCGDEGGDGSTPMPHDFEEAAEYKYDRMSEPPCPHCGREPQ
jgi:hypothetical protein